MLNQITSPHPSNQPAEDAVDLLLGCHQRIRHFTATASKLAHAQAASHDEIRMAAAGVWRYYSVSLPLHEADEEETLRPRLEALGEDRIHQALAAMHDQHQAIDDLIERLLPLLQLVERNSGTLEQAGAEMCAITKTLGDVFDAHLKLEEEAIFPAIRGRLSDTEQAAMLREMQARRKQG
jgi:iron-sulfur cluster repair protein YtfE (RIC family)